METNSVTTTKKMISFCSLCAEKIKKETLQALCEFKNDIPIFTYSKLKQRFQNIM